MSSLGNGKANPLPVEVLAGQVGRALRSQRKRYADLSGHHSKVARAEKHSGDTLDMKSHCAGCVWLHEMMKRVRCGWVNRNEATSCPAALGKGK